MIEFLNDTTLHLPSVRRPSSRICKNTLKISGCAFSISSRSITEYGLRRTASVSCPPSSWPIYPGGAQISRATAWDSIYSLISIRIIACGSLKSSSASALAVSVFPTPVGPRKRNDPMGLSGSESHALLRRIACDTFSRASSCPITCSLRRSKR